MSKKLTFIANDETKLNSYGFSVLTSGIDLEERFKENPVCLNNHQNDTKSVLGTWTNPQKDNGQLLLTPDFDTEDPEGKEVVRKVLAGKLKGCSMGIMFNPDDLVNMDGVLVLTKCVLFEVSIVAVPSNANAIRLYKSEDEEYTEQEIKSLCLNLKTAKPFKENKTMKLLTAHLQLADNATENEILLAVKGLEDKLTKAQNNYSTLKADYEALENKEKERLTAEFKAEADLAEKDGRINAEAKEHYLKLAPETGLALLKGLPKRKSIADELDKNKSTTKYEKLSWEELRKTNQLATLKADFPEMYAQKYEEKFGKKPE